MLRVCHVTAHAHRPAAGTSHAVVGLCSALQHAGVRVRLWSIDEEEERTAETQFDHRRCGNDFRTVPILERLGVSSPMRRGLRDDEADVLHAHGLWMLPNLYPARVSRRRAIPLVISPHGMLGSGALRFSSSKKRLMGVLGQSAALRQAACLVATSMKEAEDIRRFGLRQPVAVVHVGVELPPAHVSENVPGDYALYFGRIHPKKGLETFLEAWQIVESQRTDVELRIVGPDEGGYTERLGRLARDLGIRRVRILPPVFGEEKQQLISKAWVSVLPTIDDNFGVAVAESLAHCVPVVATRFSPWQGLEANRCGWWVDGHSSAIAGALCEAFSLAPSKRAKMGREGREWIARDFGWASAATAMADIYRWLVSGENCPVQVLQGGMPDAL